MNDFYINFYTVFRLALFGVTVYGTVQLIRNLVRYKPYYDKIPLPVKQFLFAQGGALLAKKFKQHQHDFTINAMLLAVLLLLNAILFVT